MPSILDLDPRWRSLQEAGGVIDIGFDHPAEWPHGERGDAPMIKDGNDQLASELCRLGDRRFIRAATTLPIRGSEDELGLAMWVEVAQETFYAYLDTMDGGIAPGASEAHLATDLGPLGERGTALSLDFGDGTVRPIAKGIPAAIEGISLDELFTLYREAGITPE